MKVTTRQRELLARLPKRFGVADMVKAGCYKGELPARGQIARMVKAGLVRQTSSNRWERGALPKCGPGRGATSSPSKASSSSSSQLGLLGRRSNPEGGQWDYQRAGKLIARLPVSLRRRAKKLVNGVDEHQGGTRTDAVFLEEQLEALLELESSKSKAAHELAKMARWVLFAPAWRAEFYRRARDVVFGYRRQVATVELNAHFYQDWRDELRWPADDSEPEGWREGLQRWEERSSSLWSIRRPRIASFSLTGARRDLVAELVQVDAFEVADAYEAGARLGLSSHEVLQLLSLLEKNGQAVSAGKHRTVWAILPPRENPESGDGKSWVLIGWDVRFELEGGGYHVLGRPWVLVTPAKGGDLGGRVQLARLIDAAPLDVVDEAAVVGWDEWSWGEDADEAFVVDDYEGMRPSRTLGRVRRVLYTTRRGGEVIPYTHKFRAPLPALVACGEGHRALRLERRGSAHYVTDRGIVG